MTAQGELFASPRQEAEKKAATVKKAPLYERMLEYFKARKFEQVRIHELRGTFAEHHLHIVDQALARLLRNGDVKAMPQKDNGGVRYTVTIYKS